MTTPQRPANTRQPLADAIAELAGTPEHAPGMEARLSAIARLAVVRVAAADFASVTALYGDEFTTVAASDSIATAVDEAQYADGDGPCLRSLRTGEPVGVPDISATMQWPGFHEVAPQLGLRASVSIPLYAGRGTPIAVLNLYGRDGAAMEPLIVAVADLYATRRELSLGISHPPVKDPGAGELLNGYARALATRATVQLAVGILAGHGSGATGDGYAELCATAEKDGTTLSAAAAAVLAAEL